jgi:TP901 family phage tail tape measure protein
MAIGDKKVGTKFTAKDGVTKRFSLMERAAARFGRSADKSFRKASRGASRFSSVTKGVVAGLGISRGLALVSQGVGSVVTQFIAFDKAALGATVRFKDIGPAAANFNDQLKLVEKSARDMGATTEFTAAQSAEALDFLARAGFTSTEAMGSLKSMIDLATASGEDFARVADISSDLLGAFGLNVKDTSQKIANLNRLNDVLVKSANSANVTIESMFDTMKTAAPIGRILGIELEEVAALTALLGSSGIKGTEAGTALKNSFLRLSAATPKTVKMLKDINVEIDDGTGNMRKFTDIIADVGAATKGLGTLQTAKIFNELFGKRAIAGATNLADSISELRDFEKMLKGAGKTSELTAEIMRTSIDAKLKTLGSSATEAGFKILNAFEVNGKKGIDSLTEAIRGFDVKPMVDGLTIIIDALVIIGKVAGFAFNMLTGIGTAIGTSIGFIGETLKARSAGVGLESTDEFGTGLDVEAPNAKEAAARAQQVNVNVGGEINVNGPAGTTAESTGPVGFNTQLLGQN